MNIPLKIFWLVSLAVFGSGCSGYHPPCFTQPEAVSADEPEDWEACGLEPGDRVRLKMASGRPVTGIIEEITSECITLEAKDAFSSPRPFTRAQIITIEKTAPVESAASVILVVVLGAAIIGGIVVSNLDFGFSNQWE